MSKPHECPVCKAKEPAKSACEACDGKGIVWEPEVVEAVSKTPVPVNGGSLDLTSHPRSGE